MLTGLLLAAAVAVTTPTSTTVSPSATVLANRTAFNQPCVWFNSTAPDRLAAAAAATLQRLGFEVRRRRGTPHSHSSQAVRRSPVFRDSAGSILARVAAMRSCSVLHVSLPGGCAVRLLTGDRSRSTSMRHG